MEEQKKAACQTPKQASLPPSHSLNSLRLDFCHPLKSLAKELHQVGKTIQQLCRGGGGEVDSVVPDLSPSKAISSRPRAIFWRLMVV